MSWRPLPRIPGRDPEEENEEELRFHLEMRIREYREAGMSEGEARTAVERRMGDLDAVRRELGAVARAEARSGRWRGWLGQLGQDLRYGARSLLRAPGFTAVSGLTLALGIGATTAIFSLVWAVLLAPLPYPQPDRLVRVWETSPQGAVRNVASSGNVVAWQAGARSFEVLGAHRQPYPVTLTGDGEPARVIMAAVQPEVLRALDVAPLVGRSMVEEDGVAGGVALLGHDLWRDRFGGAPEVVGGSVVLNDVSHTVVGVLPPETAFPSESVEVWVALPDEELDPDEHTSHNFGVLARLAPGATVESAQAELDGLVARITREHPAEMTGWGARVVPLHGDLIRNVASLFWLLLGGVGVVLLVACGNLANLLLARAVAREREMAVRGALGAGRGRILRQLLTESGLLAAVGALGAGLLAPALLDLLVRAAPPGIPHLDRAAVDLRMLAFTGAVALGCAVLFGLAPAVRLARTDLESALRGSRSASPAGHLRLRGGLLAGQVALTVMLLVGAGLFVRSYRALHGTDLGFEAEGLVLMDVDLPSPRYPDDPVQLAFWDRLVEEVAAVPGVAGVTLTSQAPGAGSMMTFSFGIEGREASNPSGREDDETLHAVGPEYFELLGRPMAGGRAFTPADHRPEGTPVVILSESLARKHFPAGDAVGGRISFRPGETPWREIVGVVADARLASPDVEPDPGIYIPYAQKRWTWLRWSTLVVRAEPGIEAATLAPGLRSALLIVDPALPPQSLGTLEAAFRDNTARRTFATSLVGGFGILALLLSVVGLYGLVSFSVARRRREIGVRMALGAGSGEVVGRVLRRSLALTLAGAGVGVGAAVAVSGVLESLLYGVSPTDPPTYAAIVVLVMAVAAGTAALPAARAARTDPVRVLRSE